MIQEAVKKQLNEGFGHSKSDYAQHILNFMDEQTLLWELIQAMDDREARENFDWIVQMHDLPDFEG